MKHKQREKRIAAANEPYIPVELPGSESGIRKNEYYLAVSRRFKLARLAMLFLLVLYMIFMIMFFGEDITVSNFKYLLRDINISSSAGEAFSGVNYSAEPIQRFDIYRGDLAYVTGSEIKLYSATGNVGLSSEISYEEPAVVSGEKYILVYDLGGYGFSLYNSFSELYRESVQYRIISADISNSGGFAVLTGGREYKSIVSLYNDDFELVSRYSKNVYITDVALSENAERLVMTSISTTASDFVTTVHFYVPGEDSEAASATVVGEYPLAVEAIENGFAVFGTGGVYFFGMDGEKTGEYKYSGNAGMTAVTDSYIVITIPQNALESRNRIIVLDSLGNERYNKVLDEKITDVSVSENGKAFVLTSGRAIMINISSNAEKSAAVSGGAKKLMATGKESALLCTASSAVTIDFSQLSEIK